MYKVLSVGGSSLKWSKSIENRSKKANEVSWLYTNRLAIIFPLKVIPFLLSQVMVAKSQTVFPLSILIICINIV